jgi:large subunit ribosomal protein L1
MAKKEETKKPKKAEKIIEREEVSEKDLLKEAEEREKERKAEEEAQKEEAKKEALVHKKEQHAEEKKKKAAARVKPRHGKKYREIAKNIEKDKEDPMAEAIELALKSSPAKFDATVEMHVKINPKEKNIRGMVTLPGGVVKEKKVLEVMEENVEDVIADVKAGKAEFDVMIADLKVMPKLAQLAKVLGPKGLMPSPKAGTAVEDVKKAAADLAGGKVEFRADKYNIVHMPLGKISFGAEKVAQNYNSIMAVLPNKKVESIYLSTTMGPSVKVTRK